MVDGERYGFTTKPVADIVCITIQQGYADAVAENLGEIFDEGVGKVAGGGEAREDL